MYDLGPTDPEDFLDLDPRSLRDSTNRLRILDALIRRAMIERDGSIDPAREKRETDRFDIVALLVDFGADADLTVRENELLESPVGTLADDDVASMLWGIEAIFALGVGIRLFPGFPDPPTFANPDSTVAALGRFLDDSGSQEAQGEVLPDDELEVVRERLEIWHWRALIELELRSVPPEGQQDLIHELREICRDAGDAAIVELDDHGDIRTTGSPVGEWDAERLGLFTLASETRLRALHWLCGFGDDWESAPLTV